MAHSTAAPASNGPASLHYCSQCRKDLPLSEFPLKATSLQPMAICNVHKWYWTTEKRAVACAPNVTSTMDEVCEQLRSQGVVERADVGRGVPLFNWVVDGPEEAAAAMLERMADAVSSISQRALPPRRSRSKKLDVSDAVRSRVTILACPETTLRVTITHNAILSKHSITVVVDETATTAREPPKKRVRPNRAKSKPQSVEAPEYQDEEDQLEDEMDYAGNRTDASTSRLLVEDYQVESTGKRKSSTVAAFEGDIIVGTPPRRTRNTSTPSLDHLNDTNPRNTLLIPSPKRARITTAPLPPPIPGHIFQNHYDFSSRGPLVSSQPGQELAPLSLAQLLASPFLGSPPLPTRKHKKQVRFDRDGSAASSSEGEEEEDIGDEDSDTMESSSEEGSSDEGEEDLEDGDLLPESSQEEESSEEEESEDEGGASGDVWLTGFVKEQLFAS